MQRMKRFLTGLIAALLLSPSAYAEGTESFGIALGSTSFQEFAGKYPAYFSKGKSGCEDYPSYGVYTSQIEDESLFSLDVSFDGNERAAAVAAKIKRRGATRSSASSVRNTPRSGPPMTEGRMTAAAPCTRSGTAMTELISSSPRTEASSR